jgi:outer membrane protein OmpA-like peptidoglycan-associated protein
MQKPKLISLLFLISLCAATALAQTQPNNAKKLKPRVVPTLQLENGVIVSQAEGYKRANAQTVCAGDKIAFTARVSGTPEAGALPVKWTVSGGRGASNVNGYYILDTTGLTPGTYTVTAEVAVAYKECEGNCTAYDSKSFVVTPCPTCFMTSTVTLTSSTPFINPGEILNICASAVIGGSGYGQLIPTWTTTAGKITGDANCAKLDTTGIAYGSTVTVNFKLTSSEIPDCEAKGEFKINVVEERVDAVSELAPCITFKKNSARVDNVCKANLVEVVRQLQSDPNAQIIIDSYAQPGEKMNLSIERGKNVRDRMADGSIGVKVDANRLIVRPSGQSDEGAQVRLYLLPAGAKLPSGAPPADVGAVSKEGGRPAPAKRR